VNVTKVWQLNNLFLSSAIPNYYQNQSHSGYFLLTIRHELPWILKLLHSWQTRFVMNEVILFQKISCFWSTTLARKYVWPKTYFCKTQLQTLKHNNVFGLTKWRHFSSKCTEPLFLHSFFPVNRRMLLLAGLDWIPFSSIFYEQEWPPLNRICEHLCCLWNEFVSTCAACKIYPHSRHRKF